MSRIAYCIHNLLNKILASVSIGTNLERYALFSYPAHRVDAHFDVWRSWTPSISTLCF